MRFNVVVANPPFSLDKWGGKEVEADRHSRFWRGLPPKSKGDYAFITHMIETALPQEGRVAVVVPHGVLFRGGAEGRIRRALIEENLLDAVIGLPGNLFPTTSIPVAILVFDRAREKGGAREACQDVLFIDASRDYQSGKNQNALLDEHMAKVLATFRARQPVDKYAHVASLRRSPKTTSTSTSRAMSTPSRKRKKSMSPPSSRRSSAWKRSWPRCACA
jgi:type I restriction enzyme M protein